MPGFGHLLDFPKLNMYFLFFKVISILLCVCFQETPTFVLFRKPFEFTVANGRKRFESFVNWVSIKIRIVLCNLFQHCPWMKHSALVFIPAFYRVLLHHSFYNYFALSQFPLHNSSSQILFEVLKITSIIGWILTMLPRVTGFVVNFHFLCIPFQHADISILTK